MFPDNANAKYQWHEPWFFILRSSTAVGWVMRGGFFLGVYVLFAVLLSMESNSPDQPHFGMAEIIVLPAMVAGLFLTLIELPNIQRLVTLTDSDISCIGTLMALGGPIHLLLGPKQWNRREIKHVQLLRTGELGNEFPFSLMVITPKYARAKKLAVPSTVTLNDIADHLCSIGVDVELTDWQPPASDPPASHAPTQ